MATKQDKKIAEYIAQYGLRVYHAATSYTSLHGRTLAYSMSVHRDALVLERYREDRREAWRHLLAECGNDNRSATKAVNDLMKATGNTPPEKKGKEKW